MPLSRMVARPMLSSVFFLGGVNAFKNANALAAKAQPVTDKVVPIAKQAVPVLPDDPEQLVKVNAVVQLFAATTLATGKAPRLSALVLAGSLVPTTVAGHAFWAESTPEAKNAQRLQFAKNLSILGGLLIAAGDTEGKPGVAWRTRRAAKDAKRAARQEARLVKAKLG